jgi:hypothetical protein
MLIVDVEQGTDEWFAARVGIPTASSFSRLVTGTGKASSQLSDYAAELAADMYAGKPLERWGGNEATERGHETEPQARYSYEFDNGVEVVKVGFIVNHGAGCSPDGLVGDDGLHEIKCQMAKGHVQTLAYYSKNKACPPGYLPQVYGQLLICEREWCDLSFFHPDLPGLTVRVVRDESYMAELLRGIKAVCEERDKLVEMIRSAA